MLARIVTEFGYSLPSLEWMDEKTKQKAVKKLDALGHKIGFPEISQNIKRLEEYYSKVNIKDFLLQVFFIAKLSEQNILLFINDKL